MKMIMAVVPKKYGDDALSALINAGFTATYYETRGGMLRQSQYTLHIAVHDDAVPVVLKLLNEATTEEILVHQGFGLVEDPAEIVGKSGSVAFIWSLDSFKLS